MSIRVADSPSSRRILEDSGSSADVRNPSVWISCCDGGSDARSFDHLLSCEEIKRCEALKLPADRERLIGSRVLLRVALSRVVGNDVHPSAWRFATGRFGKPEVASGLPALNFNLSHSENMVAVAIDPFEPIGIDVERLDDMPTRELPLSALSRTECLVLDLCSPRSRYREFIKLWTLKEAHAKRLGYGVHLDFPSFDIVWQPGRDAEEIETSDGSLVTRLLAMADAAYRLSVAVGGQFPRRPIVWRQGAVVADIARLFSGGNNEVTTDFCTIA